MDGSGILTEVQFHSHKHCFIVVECSAMNDGCLDTLHYFEIRQSGDDKKNSIYVAGYIHSRERSLLRPRLSINGVFANVLGIKLNDQVLVTRLQSPRVYNSVVASPASSDDWEVVSLNAEKIEEQLLGQLRMIYVGLEFPFWIDGGYCLFLRVGSCDSSIPYGLLGEDTEVTVAPKLPSIGRPNNAVQPNSVDQLENDSDYESLLLIRGIKCFDAILEKLLFRAEVSLSHCDPVLISQPLLAGTVGAGKSLIMRAFCYELKARKAASHTSIIDCKQLRGKAVESVEKRLKDRILEASKCQPSVIILDDLDCLCPACDAMEQITPGAGMLYERLSRMLTSLLRETRQRRQRILFLGTCVSTKSINRSLVSPRGMRFFDVIAEIPDLNVESRTVLFERLVLGPRMVENRMKASPKSRAWIGKRTEGYVVADLAAVAERTVLARIESGKGTDLPDISDFKVALEGFIPSAMIGAGDSQTNTGVQIHLDDIGGLREAKEVLEKLLLLPTKYPKIFATIPIRLPRGILLYGPTGCGKTLLAAAVVNDYNLKLISVKGAELLSKYIGASEQAVRDTFRRAKAMKPCLVFFDEFDALAPRRGHDSTGVTDRVVNQLLTEMDGVEGLEGVFVLAASSRPDLIDPALLRPGRIDKRVFCGMPSQTDRLDILKRLSKPLSLCAGVDIDSIAGLTDGYSGADLKRLLLDSYVMAVKEKSQETEDRESIGELPVITQDHILVTLRSLSPSVSVQERRRFEKMYAMYQGQGDAEEPARYYQEFVGKKATLA